MGLESAASRSLVSSSSPKPSNPSSSMSFDIFVFVAALLVSLDFEVGWSDEHAAATSFKAVVRDLFPIGCVDLRINRQQVLFQGMSLTCLGLFARLMAAKNCQHPSERCVRSITKGVHTLLALVSALRFFSSTSLSDDSLTGSAVTLALFFRLAGVKATGAW